MKFQTVPKKPEIGEVEEPLSTGERDDTYKGMGSLLVALTGLPLGLAGFVPNVIDTASNPNNYGNAIAAFAYGTVAGVSLIKLIKSRN
ncbi:hypothetical protein KC930_04190 [Candidatus Saccharibacteria bacterium]|nr:hypothetical protein [Candidatus Saccharibacteria bacterium]